MQEFNQEFNNDKNLPTPLPDRSRGQVYQGERSPLGRGQKIAAAGLAVFAILAIGLWVAQFKKSISGQFVYKETGGEEINALTEDENSAEALRGKDTDSDGLSDWDELNVYRTSPYLEDSDSDGFTDKKELDSGNDPNCPNGRNCAGTGLVEGDKEVTQAEDANSNPLAGENSTSDNLLNILGGSLQGQTGAATGSASTGMEGVLSGAADAAGLRKMLLDAGMDKNLLDKLSDDDLMKAYQEMLSNK